MAATFILRSATENGSVAEGIGPGGLLADRNDPLFPRNWDCRLPQPTSFCNRCVMPGFFRPNDFRLVHQGHLPHWRQNDVVYFVTTRLADSMPKERLLEWRDRRDSWLAGHGIRDAGNLDSLTDELRHEFHNTFTRKWH